MIHLPLPRRAPSSRTAGAGTPPRPQPCQPGACGTGSEPGEPKAKSMASHCATGRNPHAETPNPPPPGSPRALQRADRDPQHRSGSPAAGLLPQQIKLGTSLLEIQQISANPPCSRLPNPPPPPSQGAELFKASCTQPLILATRNRPSRRGRYPGIGRGGRAAAPMARAAGAGGRGRCCTPQIGFGGCPDSELMWCCRSRRLRPLRPHGWMLFLSRFPRPCWEEDQK